MPAKQSPERIELPNGCYWRPYEVGSTNNGFIALPDGWQIAGDVLRTSAEKFAAAMAPSVAVNAVAPSRSAEVEEALEEIRRIALTAANHGTQHFWKELLAYITQLEASQPVVAQKRGEVDEVAKEAAHRLHKAGLLYGYDPDEAKSRAAKIIAKEFSAPVVATASEPSLQMVMDVIRGEKVDFEATKDEGDAIYNRAVDDCLYAVEQLFNGQLPATPAPSDAREPKWIPAHRHDPKANALEDVQGWLIGRSGNGKVSLTDATEAINRAYNLHRATSFDDAREDKAVKGTLEQLNPLSSPKTQDNAANGDARECARLRERDKILTSIIANVPERLRLAVNDNWLVDGKNMAVDSDWLRFTTKHIAAVCVRAKREVTAVAPSPTGNAEGVKK